MTEFAKLQEKADDAFEDYIFGEGVSVEDSDSWDTNDNEDYIKIVYVIYEGEESEDTSKISFHVNFNKNGEVTDSYALDMDSGNEIGTSSE